MTYETIVKVTGKAPNFLIKEAQSDPSVAIALSLLEAMAQSIATDGVDAIATFRREYLKQTGGGYFDTLVREKIAEVYVNIVATRGLEDEANALWR